MSKRQKTSGAVTCKCSACGKTASAPSGSKHRWLSGARHVPRSKRKRCGGKWEAA